MSDGEQSAEILIPLSTVRAAFDAVQDELDAELGKLEAQIPSPLSPLEEQKAHAAQVSKIVFGIATLHKVTESIFE